MGVEKIHTGVMESKFQINPKKIETIATSSNWGKVENPDKFDILIAQNFDKFAKGEIFVGGEFIPQKQSLFQKIMMKINRIRINK